MARRSAARPASRHPVNQAMLDDAPVGARIADGVTGFLGSWRFLILQTVLVAIWLGANASCCPGRSIPIRSSC